MMEKKKLKILEWRKRCDWLQEGKLVEVLAMLEITCVMEDQMDGEVESKTNEMDMMMDEKMDIGYEWLEDGGLVEISARLEIYACTMESYMDAVKEYTPRSLTG